MSCSTTSRTSQFPALAAIVLLLCATPSLCLGEHACPGDLDGDYEVNLADLAQLLAHYGEVGGVAYENGDMDDDGDVDIADLAAMLAVYGTTCHSAVIFENEPCGDFINGGCGADPAYFEPIDCGAVIDGTAWAEDGMRDTDWYEIVVTEPTSFTWTAQAEFPVMIGLVGTDTPGSGDCYDVYGLSYYDTAGILPDEATFTTDLLPPGTYWFWIAPRDFDDLPCGGWNDYVASLTCTD